jgi:hypothetical protein
MTLTLWATTSCSSRAILALTLQLVRSVAEHLDLQRPAAHRPSAKPSERGEEHGRNGVLVAGAGGERPHQPDRGGQHANRDGEEMAATFSMSAGRVGHNQPRQENLEPVLPRVRRIAERELEHQRRHRDGDQDSQRETAAHANRQKHHQRDEHTRPDGVGEASVEDIDDAYSPQHERDSPVHAALDRAPARGDSGTVHDRTVPPMPAARIRPQH